MSVAARLLESVPKVYDVAHEVALLKRWDVTTSALPAISRQSSLANEKKHARTNDAEPLIMCFPPPNLTGVLHLGHALTVSIQDAISRHARMCGRPVIWIPGFDHAGIAAQTVFEKHLRSRGVAPSSLSRDAFRQQLGEFAAVKRDAISRQLLRLGATLSWPLTTYTLDARFDEAVREAFVRLHRDGLVFRADRIVNWCPALRTAISDVEVEHVDVSSPTKLKVPGYKKEVEFGRLFLFAYALDGAPAGEIVVATTRPETIFGDVAVVVHPEDPRYAPFIGRFVRHPFTGARLPVLADARVDRQFGTGAMKVTPAHDPADQELALSHKLPSVTVMDETGQLDFSNLRKTLARDGVQFDASELDRFDRRPRFEVRLRVIERLAEHGLLRGKRDHAYRVPRCSRSGDVLEPRLTRQWFVDTHSLAERAVAAVRNGALRLVPAHHEASWYEFLGARHRPWCVSRQLDWGHQIPAYRPVLADEQQSDIRDADADWIVAKTEFDASKIGRERFGDRFAGLKQSTDVLDTWFSSGLYPFASLGWPNWSLPISKLTQSQIRSWYPTTLLETGQDILFFWVARMTMLGLALTDTLPFHTVLLHGIVRDARGRKMSKSVGNVLDPLAVVDGTTLTDLRLQLERDLLGDSPSNAPTSAAEQFRVAAANQRSMFPNGVPRCGADALRLTLLECDAHAESAAFNVNHATANRNFCNKLHQALRFCLMRYAELESPVVAANDLHELLSDARCTRVDRWILAELCSAVRECDRAFQSFELHRGAVAARRFVYQRFCALYLESTKPRPNSTDDATARDPKSLFAYQTRVLQFCLRTSLAMLHPFMPFVTEQLHDVLKQLGELDGQNHSSLLQSTYPQPGAFTYTSQSDEAIVTNCVEPLISRVLLVCRTVMNTNAMKGGVLSLSVSDELSGLSEFSSMVYALTRAQRVQIVNKEVQENTGDYRTLWIDAGLAQQSIRIGIPITIEQLKTAASGTLKKALQQQETLLERRRAKKLAEVETTTPPQDTATTLEEEDAKLKWLRNVHEAVSRLLASS